MGIRIVAITAVLAMLFAQAANADVRSDAVRLLAHRVRQTGVDPKHLTISGVTVAADQALLSWDSGKQHGIMGLVLSADRWWDALDMTTPQPRDTPCWQTERAYPLIATVPYPAEYRWPNYESPPSSHVLLDAGFGPALVRAAASNIDEIRRNDDFARKAAAQGKLTAPGCVDVGYTVPAQTSVAPRRGTIHPPVRSFTSGYDVTIAYSPNDAKSDTKLTQLYARAPTHAEFAPNHPPAPGFGGPDAVCFFDLQIGGSKPVTFARGTTVDIWFPFVIDDQLRYNLSFFSAGKPSGMIFATIFDNTLHFVLPQFTLVPDTPLMAEIDGDPKGPS